MSMIETIETFHGHSFKVPSEEWQRYYDDECTIRDRYWDPQPGETVIDVGAAFGSYTITAMACGAEAIAVDPSPEAIAKLAECAALNWGACRVLVAALWEGGPYPFGLTTELMATYPHLVAPGDARWSTLDAEFSDLERVDWIKIDVEGGELGVLRGGLEMLRRHHPRLLIEDHTRVCAWTLGAKSRERIEALLSELGYDCELVPFEPHGFPWRDYLVAR